MSLNVNNGTLDLRTGILKEHNRSDLITKIGPVEYHAGARSERWDAFLDRIFSGKKALIAYVKRAVGMSATGDTGERVLLFCHGDGANGKTQLMTAIRLTLGDYAGESEPSTFTHRKDPRGPNENIAALYRLRFVTSVETDASQHLDVSVLKRATGGESLWYERKFGHGFPFKPEFTLWLCGNEEPVITDTTNSIWDRLKKIPFSVRIPQEEQIRDYGIKLFRECKSAILAWIVEGCLEWQATGLQQPEEVTVATQAYRDDQDVLHDFFAEECRSDMDADTLTVSNLFKHYKEWCDTNHVHSLGKIIFNSKVMARSAVKFSGTGNKPTWRGIRLATSEEKSKVNGEVNS